MLRQNQVVFGSALLALALVFVGSVSGIPPLDDECPADNPEFTSPIDCAKALTGCVCLWNISLTTGVVAGDCKGCWVRFTGTRNCTGAPNKTYNKRLTAECGEGTGHNEQCPCTGSPFEPTLFEMNCTSCPIGGGGGGGGGGE